MPAIILSAAASASLEQPPRSAHSPACLHFPDDSIRNYEFSRELIQQVQAVDLWEADQWRGVDDETPAARRSSTSKMKIPLEIGGTAVVPPDSATRVAEGGGCRSLLGA